MFWRQATNAKILVDAAGKALVYASAGSEVNNCCIAYRSDSDTVAVAEVVMVEGIDNWGATEITVSTADNVRSFTVDGTTYSFTDGAAITPAVTEFTSIAVLGKVQVFKDEECTTYADGTETVVYLRVNEEISIGNILQFGNEEAPSSYLAVQAGNIATNPGLAQLWVYWGGAPEMAGAIPAGTVIQALNSEEPFVPVSNPTVIFE